MYQTDPKQARKEKRQGIKDAIHTNQQKVAKEARLDSKMAYKTAKKNYRLAKKDYIRHQGPHLTARALFFNQQKDKAKLEKQIAKTVYKRSKKADDTYIPNQLKRRARQGTKMKVRQDTEKALRDNDVLGDWVKARQDIRQFHYQKSASKRALEAGGKLAKYSIKHSYGQLNRAYNFTRGRGFTRTPKEFSWEGKLTRKIRAAKQKVARSRAGRVAKGTGKALKVATKPLRSILANPLAIKSYFLMFLIFSVTALFMGILGGSGPVQQDEFDLNQSWLHISKRDREKSNDKVEYWTNIDDILFFMNYRYGSEWTPESNWKDGRGGALSGNLGFNHYSDALNDLWNHLNEDINDLKNMSSLYGSSSTLKWAKLEKDDLEEYKELLELSKEVGKYPAYQELENPFYQENEKAYQEPLVIQKRFGYTSKTEVYNGTTFQIERGKPIYAPMSGMLEITKDKDLLIKTDETILTLKNVGDIQQVSVDKVSAGEKLGTVSTDGGQEIFYQKVESIDNETKKKKWTYLNIGFYFEKVTYQQETFVLSSSVDGDKAQTVQFIHEYLKKNVSGMKLNGLSSILGNWDVESGIKAKRAEGDYLNPPVGASASSWDDESWLSLNGPAIYNGRYPNIIHRGLGLGQWTDTADGSTRHTMLLNYAKAKNKKWYDLELQLDFMLNGDAPWYRQKVREILTSDASVEDLTYTFLVQWEGNPGDKLPQRTASAKQWLTFLKNNKNGGQKGRGGHMFNEPYVVIQPYGRTPWSQGAGAWMYPKGYHDGLDLVVKRANYNSSVIYSNDIPVFAVVGGTVTSVGGPTQWGNFIVIQTDLGGYTYYGHLKYPPSLPVGKRVEKGEQIAVLGDTGTTGVPHVHFSYYYGTYANDVDPSFLFKTNGTLVQDEVLIP